MAAESTSTGDGGKLPNEGTPAPFQPPKNSVTSTPETLPGWAGPPSLLSWGSSRGGPPGRESDASHTGVRGAHPGHTGQEPTTPIDRLPVWGQRRVGLSAAQGPAHLVLQHLVPFLAESTGALASEPREAPCGCFQTTSQTAPLSLNPSRGSHSQIGPSENTQILGLFGVGTADSDSSFLGGRVMTSTLLALRGGGPPVQVPSPLPAPRPYSFTRR